MKQLNLQKQQNIIRNKFLKVGVRLSRTDTNYCTTDIQKRKTV